MIFEILKTSFNLNKIKILNIEMLKEKILVF